ncbi:MAG: ABC transporter permease, partial [Chloroflexi bacterium]|nr:ABC transporter permease [Chloroflexota bacterium]
LGSKRRDTLSQFRTEAALRSIGGGLLGVGAGVVASRVLDGFNLAGSELMTVFSADIAALALVVSAAIGLFFGIYPAARAAQLHPIEALRHE